MPRTFATRVFTIWIGLTALTPAARAQDEADPTGAAAPTAVPVDERAGPPAEGADAATDTLTEPPADEASDPPPDDEGPEVRALIAEAVAEYDAAHYPEAQSLFRRAQELSPSARTLRGVGMAAFEMRQYVVALRALRASLSETRRALSAAQRRHVEGLILRTQIYVGRVRIEVEPDEARVQIDGVPLDPQPDGTVLLDAGEHALSARSAGHLPRTLDFQVAGDTDQTVRLVLPPRNSPTREVLTRLGIGVLSLGVATGVASAVTGVLALGAQDRLRQDCAGFVCPGTDIGVRDDVRTFALATDVLWISAAALGVTGLAILIAGLAYRESWEQDVQVGAMCGPGGCGAVLRGRM